MEIYAYNIGAEAPNGEDPRSEIENAGYQVAHWYADEVITGSLPRLKAPQFAAMLEGLNKGDVVIVTGLHHLGCNPEDVLTTIQAMDEREIDVIVLELDKVNIASNVGRTMVKMLNAVVEMERRQASAADSSRSESARAKVKTGGRAVALPRELRARIITEYSQGVAVAELAQRYHLPRTRIQSVVDPKRKRDEPLPLAWGD